jgi:hypothetical protein
VFSDNGNSKTNDLIHCGESWYDNGWLTTNPGGRALVAAQPLHDEKTPTEEKSLLGQNYPNPFSGKTTIPFNVPVKQHVKLQVFDMQGKLVNELVNGTLEVGDYEAVFERETAQRGFLIYQLHINGTVIRKKMMIGK